MKKCENQYSDVTTYIMPEKIIDTKNTENAEELLLCETRQASTSTSIPLCKIENNGYILLDFGEEIHGGILLTVRYASPDANLRVTFGESVSEALSYVGYKNAGNDHALRDFTMPIASISTLKVGNTGFRFVKLEAVGGEIKLRSVQGAYEHCGIEQRGYFHCSDEKVNKIWETSVKTVYLCMHEYIWDGIKRDRLVWLGDMHPEIAVTCSVFGNPDCIPRSLDIGKNEFPDGNWINDIPSYSYQWIRCHYLWYMQNGDLEYLKKQSDYLKMLIHKADEFIGSDGKINLDHKFIDWSACETPYEDAGIRSILILALNEAAFLCSELNETELKKTCKNIVQRLKLKITPFDGNKQIASLCVLAGLADANKVYEKILAPNDANGLSTFMGYYTLQAIMKAGFGENALDIMKKYWGAMLDFGATTFWEEFDLEWVKNSGRIDEITPEGKDDLHGDFGKFCFNQLRLSLCHGWAGGPAAYLMNYVLGVEILEAGCKKIRIKPNLSGLSFAEGKYPTPYGDIFIKHTSENGDIKTEINAPEGIEISNL